MKVVAMLGGLGSQMFKYAFFLQIKEDDECYIDTTSYRLQKMWNGYELERIFGIEEDDITAFVSDNEIENFKNRGLNYKYVAETVIKGLDSSRQVLSFFRGYCYSVDTHIIAQLSMLIYNKVKRMCSKKNEVNDRYPFFYKTKRFSVYYDEFNHTSDKYLGGGEAKEKLVEIFKFPAFQDERNVRASEQMKNIESVALHIRRSDHMYDNRRLFDTGYYRKAVHYIKEQTASPCFFLFSDESDWCRNNLEILGLNTEDKVRIIDWNNGDQSFCDMQLMTYCRHNILAISSFGWWGYYLSNRKEKIVCAPEGYWLEIEIHF